MGALVGAACLAGLPLTTGFPGRWLVLQSFLAEPHPGRLWLHAVFALALAAVAFGSALQAAAAVRLIGIGFLGRPRTPQAAAAEDAPRRVRLMIAALAGSCMLAGLWPSALLALVQPALAQLLGLRLDGGRLLVIAAQADAPGYAALGIAAMLALAGSMVAWTLRQFANPAASRVPAWDGGMDAAPVGLLFGASATQYSAASAGLTVLQSFGYPAWRSNMQRWLKLSTALLQRPVAAGLGGALLLVLLGLLLWAVA
jgi:formate hydrogenlyase subunit 3/multisubunit Na+/H+ antiporter MnhD subunit